MRLSFRQGVVSSQTAPFLFYNSSGNIDLLARNKSLLVTVAHRTSNYLHSEDNTVTSAWEGDFLATQSYYLYLEFDTKTFERTFGYTTEAPFAQPNQPASPTLQTTWYNTSTNEQFKWIGNSYSPVLRVFIAKFNNLKFTSLSDQLPSFYGTQIGSNQSVKAGRIMYSEFGKTILRDSGTFVTTEDQFFTNQAQVVGVRLESNITTAKASESLAAYQIVAVDIDGNIRPAQYNDVEDRIIAVVTENLLVNQIGNIIVQGTVTNPNWNFTGLPAGTKLYVQNGELVRTDPYNVNPVTYPKPQVPVAKVFSTDSVIFEQGLGGVGPTGPTGSVDNIPAATKATLGGVLLSTVPTQASTPVVVTTNDPRLAGAPFAAGNHTHTADQVSVSTVGNVDAATVQAAIEELDTEKLSTAGGEIDGDLRISGVTTLSSSLFIDNGGLTVNGNALFNNLLTLTADPVAPFEAATKRYVDNLTSGLKWLDPVCLANLIGDDLSNPSGLTPENGDAYILSANGSGDWSEFVENDIVRWDSPNATWVNGGQMDTTNFPELRFIIAGNTSTPARGSFAGKEREIVDYDDNGENPTFISPENSNAVYVCNSFSSAAFNQYVYNVDSDSWRQTGGTQSGVAADMLTIRQVGSIISTIPFADGGTVDATTYRGEDLDTVYSPINHNHDDQYAALGHVHDASAINIATTIKPSGNNLNPIFGYPLVTSDIEITNSNVRVGLQELLTKKASRRPIYNDFFDLPDAQDSLGMYAYVDNRDAPYVAIRFNDNFDWVPVAVNDNFEDQNHTHTINYDFSFFAAGPVATAEEAVLGRMIVPRRVIIYSYTFIYARVITAPTQKTIFTININGNPSNITITFDPAVNEGLIPVEADTGDNRIVMNEGDYIDLVAPSSIEGNIAGLAVTIAGNASTKLSETNEPEPDFDDGGGLGPIGGLGADSGPDQGEAAS